MILATVKLVRVGLVVEWPKSLHSPRTKTGLPEDFLYLHAVFVSAATKVQCVCAELAGLR